MWLNDFVLCLLRISYKWHVCAHVCAKLATFCYVKIMQKLKHKATVASYKSLCMVAQLSNLRLLYTVI